MKLLLITDPDSHPEGDTTVDLYIRAASHPEIELFHIQPEKMLPGDSLQVAEVLALGGYEEFLALGRAVTQELPVKYFSLAFSRTDKPYPNGYLDNLESLAGRLKFVNEPSGIKRHVSGEIFYEAASRFIPTHIFTRNLSEVKNFFEEFPTLVAKRSGSYGGKGVFKIWKEGEDYLLDNVKEGLQKFPSLEALVSWLFESDPGQYQFVRFLKNIAKGDKRVLVVDGEVYGGYLRRSKSEHWVHNFTAGGGIYPEEVGEREREVVMATCQTYHRAGIRTLGYDFLVDDDGTWVLSEINAGNIGGYGRLEELYGFPAWDKLLTWLVSLPGGEQC